MTASIATELYVSLLQHPLRALAPIPNSTVADPAFGATPHQIRGHLSSWEQQCLSGVASAYCAGCGDKVVNEWKVHGMEFVRRVCQRGGGMVIERVSGLEEVKKGYEEGWDGGDEGDEDDDWEL
jgi:ubiquitin-like modifier-activating enzyme ATG7